MICLRCGKKFDRRFSFLRHLKRNKKCEPKLLDVSYEEMKESYEDLLEIAKMIKNEEKVLAEVSRLLAGKDEKSKKCAVFSKTKKKLNKLLICQDATKKNAKKNNFTSEISKIETDKKSETEFKSETKLIEDNNKFKCQFCHKSFKHKSSFSRHLKKRCKIKNKIEIYNEESGIGITEILNKINEFRPSSQTINNYYMSTQNITNNTQNIIINNYGKENISYITQATLHKIINGPFASIQRTNSLIHFNKDHPENMNVKMSDKEDSKFEVFKGNKWCPADKKRVIKEMVDRAMVLIDEYYQNIGKNSLPECKNELYQKFQKAYNSCPEFKKRLHEDIENMIMNGGLLD